MHKRLREDGGGLTLISPHEWLLRIFRMTALDHVFTVITTPPGTTTTEPSGT
nr:hypothetical protein GCM10020063_042330 [Dactylosporangium thailandense]